MNWNQPIAKVGQKQREFTKEEKSSWFTILSNHKKTRENQIYELFHNGVKTLGISETEIPDLNKINQKLKSLTGFEGVFVDGLEDGTSFYRMLANKQFPVGNFIRDKKDLSYTPAPDIVHDLYGHLPFFADKNYADFCYRFGVEACKFINNEKKLHQFERLFWFTIEFGLIKTTKGPRVFGAGIASSTGECEYALSGKPEILPFDLDKIRKQEFKIDEMQKRLFILDSPEQLYSCLDKFVSLVNSDEC
jgi:phenylalanine-4-hydroxylase